MPINQPSFRICSLFSGSGGNCTYVHTPDVSFLIDAGKSAKAIRCGLEAIGVGTQDIACVFLTHEHIDHISALPVFLKTVQVPVYLPRACLSEVCMKLRAGEETHLVPRPPLFQVRFGGTTVSSFITSHDSLASVGYRIDYADASGAKRSFGYATDLGVVNEYILGALSGCEGVVLESNHDSMMLWTGTYSPDTKSRIAADTGHLSNADAAELAADLEKTGTKSFLLAHLSRENNDPQIAIECVRTALKDKSIPVLAASPVSCTDLDLGVFS